MPYELVEHVSWLIYARRRELNSPRRRLGRFKQALLAPAHLRKNETFAQAGTGFGVSETTAWHYVDETPELLAAWAPGPHEALVGLGESNFVIVDGTPIPTNRINADEPYHSQKHKQHGMNAQVITAPDATPLWFLPHHTRTHSRPDAARTHGIVRPVRPGRYSYPRTTPAKTPAPPSAPRTTTANNPPTTSSPTTTTPVSRRPENTPSPG